MNNYEINICPICGRLLHKNDFLDEIYTEYECIAYSKDHFYSKRCTRYKIKAEKIRLTKNNNHIFVKVDYENNTSFIWTQPGQSHDGVFIQDAIKLDYLDLDRLEEKLKAYLVFS